MSTISVLSNNNRQTSPPVPAWCHVLIIPVTWKVEAIGPWVQDQPGLYSKTLFQKNDKFLCIQPENTFLGGCKPPPTPYPHPGALPWGGIACICPSATVSVAPGLWYSCEMAWPSFPALGRESRPEFGSSWAFHQSCYLLS